MRSLIAWLGEYHTARITGSVQRLSVHTGAQFVPTPLSFNFELNLTVFRTTFPQFNFELGVGPFHVYFQAFYDKVGVFQAFADPQEPTYSE